MNYRYTVPLTEGDEMRLLEIVAQERRSALLAGGEPPSPEDVAGRLLARALQAEYQRRFGAEEATP